MKMAEGGSAVEWHQDTAYGPNTNGDNLTVGLYLDDATTDNGCMLMIPGSHKGPALDHEERRAAAARRRYARHYWAH